ncbi:GDSL-type esterase/lipase family protein [Luteimonas huabeiensis]|uniref:GDSL-type esterase/lipase family protein n=1 Tax=Luteimonas huabeiensis TaxID=1244513 RepID=UPI000465CDB5
MRAVVACAWLWALCAGAVAGERPARVFVVGDSTASAYGPERAPRTGWGQALQSFLDPAAFEVRNHARSGRSARSFAEEGWLAPVEDALAAGDVLLIQFGHNDAKAEDPSRYDEPERAFPDRLRRYLALAHERGARPVLLTPVARRAFRDGEPVDTHGAYAEAVRALAAREGVPLIDLDRASRDWLRALGEAPSTLYYLHDPAQGLADDTHFNLAGATQVACLVVREWRRAAPEIDRAVVRDTDCGAPPDAPRARAAQARPSTVQHARDVPRREQPGPHGGPGPTVARPYFEDAPGLPFVLRKRVLQPGAGIGLHPQHKDEIYYVLAGRGRYVVDGAVHEVGPGDAMLTRPGSTHAVQQAGDAPLELLIVYPQATSPADPSPVGATRAPRGRMR